MYDSLPSSFRLARLAREHSNHRYQMGAVIVRHRPISIGFNHRKTHPAYSDGTTFYSIHAEMSAILKSRGNLTDSVMFVYRENSDGSPALARPCKKCIKHLIEAGIKRVYFTINEPPYYKRIDL